MNQGKKSRPSVAAPGRQAETGTTIKKPATSAFQNTTFVGGGQMAIKGAAGIE